MALHTTKKCARLLLWKGLKSYLFVLTHKESWRNYWTSWLLRSHYFKWCVPAQDEGLSLFPPRASIDVSVYFRSLLSGQNLSSLLPCQRLCRLDVHCWNRNRCFSKTQTDNFPGCRTQRPAAWWQWQAGEPLLRELLDYPMFSTR